MSDVASSVKAATVPELIERRRAYGAAWERAFAEDDIDSCEALMAGIRKISDEIAERVGVKW